MSENIFTEKNDIFYLYRFKTTDLIQKEEAININYIYKLLYKYDKNFKYINNIIYINEDDFKNMFPNNNKLHKFLYNVSKIGTGDFRKTYKIMTKEYIPKILNFD